jgi:hypothetical protein
VTVGDSGLTFQREGEFLTMNGRVTVTGTGTAGDFYLSLSGITPVLNQTGVVRVEETTTGYAKTYLVYADSNGRFLFYTQNNGSVASASLTSLDFGSINSGKIAAMYFHGVAFKISEWAGSGTVQLAQNDVEYASNSSSTNADDLTSFVSGPSGAVGILGTTNLTAARVKRIRFQAPAQVGDKFEIEIKDTTGAWFPHNAHPNGSFAFASSTAGVYSGILLDQVNSTDFDVTFYPTPTQFSSSAWASQIAGGWRVRKSSAGAAVGFGIVVPGTSSGLVSASGLPGRTDGGTVATGYVGQVVQSNSSSSSMTTGTNISVANLSIPSAGVWAIYATAEFAGSATACTQIRASINTSAAASYINSTTSAFVSGYDSWSPNTSINLSKTLPIMYRTVAAAETIYMYAAAVFSGGNMTTAGYFTAIRIA